MNSTMKLVVFLCALSIAGILILGSNMYKDVPVIKVSMSLVEKQDGTVEVQNYTLVQDNVNYINRPKRINAKSFPAISGRIFVNKRIGSWESISYNGTGNYTTSIAFPKDYVPKFGDPMHITIMVVDKDGTKIGYLTENIKWK